MKPAIIGTVLVLVMGVFVTAQGLKPPHDTPESCRAFVQSFYDWYVPLASEESKVAASDLALERRPTAFAPELSRLLKRDSEAQAKAHEIVGIDFDPFLNSQDPSDKFVAEAVTRKGDSFWVDVYGMSSGHKAEHVIPEVRFTDGQWHFVNFHYAFDGHPDDLIGLLRRLAAERKTTSTVSHKRAIPCKTPSNAASCYWAHGRLGFYNGTPAFRLWKVGTHRLLGIYSGPSVDRYGEDNEHPEFPANVGRVFKPSENRIFADFEVCPLESERQGAMQAACIESAKNIVVEK